MARLVQGRADWYRIENKAEAAEVYIYDEIGYFGVTANDFVRDLRNVTSSKINLHLNTPGGDVFDGIAIFNALKAHKATVNVIVDGLAASAGSFIAMAGDRVAMAPHSKMMIHEAFGLAIGNAEDMAKMAERLDATSENIAGIYAERAGNDATHWRALMKAETWFTDQEAVDAGLADEVAREIVEDDHLRNFDLSIFRNATAIAVDASTLAASTDTVTIDVVSDEEPQGEPTDEEDEQEVVSDPLAELRSELEARLSNPPINVELEVELDRVLARRK